MKEVKKPARRFEMSDKLQFVVVVHKESVLRSSTN